MQTPLINRFKIQSLFAGILVFLSSACFSTPAQAYPVYAQQGYENPREATGRIVCANCHLAQKPRYRGPASCTTRFCF
jgi:hypothetical protein